MNIFNDLGDFQINVSLYKVFDAIDGFFPLASKIRKRLDGQAYLLDNYLKTIFRVLDQSTLFGPAEAAQRDYREFRIVCSDIMHNKHESFASPFYASIKTFLVEHEDKYRDDYFLQEMAVAFAVKIHAKELIEKYFDKQRHEIAKHMDVVELRTMYRTISYSVGHDIDRLNEMIKNQFLVAPIADAYIHAFLNHYLMQLITSDSISSKMLFQAMLEEVSEVIINEPANLAELQNTPIINSQHASNNGEVGGEI